MAYFFVLPLFVFYLAVGAIAIAAARIHQPWRPAFAVMLWGYCGSIIGFTAANVGVNAIALGLVVESVTLPGPQALRESVGVHAILMFFWGPFLASLVGITLGIGLGGWVGARRRLRYHDV